MNTLRSSSSKIVVDKFGVSPRELFFCRPETCSFRARKVVNFGFLHLISVQHKGVPVVSCLSSTSQVLSFSSTSFLLWVLDVMADWLFYSFCCTGLSVDVVVAAEKLWG